MTSNNDFNSLIRLHGWCQSVWCRILWGKHHSKSLRLVVCLRYYWSQKCALTAGARDQGKNPLTDFGYENWRYGQREADEHFFSNDQAIFFLFFVDMKGLCVWKIPRRLSRRFRGCCHPLLILFWAHCGASFHRLFTAALTAQPLVKRFFYKIWIEMETVEQYELENEARGLWHFFHDSLVWLLVKHFGFSFSKGADCFTPTAEVCHWASTGSSCDHHVRPLAKEDEVTTPSNLFFNGKRVFAGFCTCKSVSWWCQLTGKKPEELQHMATTTTEMLQSGAIFSWSSGPTLEISSWQLTGKMPPTFKPLWVSKWAPTHRSQKKNTLCVQLQ